MYRLVKQIIYVSQKVGVQAKAVLRRLWQRSLPMRKRISIVRPRISRAGVALLVVASMIMPLIQFDRAGAATATMNPNTDVTKGWPTTTSGTTHYSLLNGGTSPNDSAYVSTGTNGSGGEIEEFGMDSPSSVQSASSITVYVRLRSSPINSNADTVDFALAREWHAPGNDDRDHDHRVH